MAPSILVCRNCGARTSLDMAINEQELANVGMLERRCARCGLETTWGLLENYRRTDRRVGERRGTERRTKTQAPPAGEDRRRPSERRYRDMRSGQRRRGR